MFPKSIAIRLLSLLSVPLLEQAPRARTRCPMGDRKLPCSNPPLLPLGERQHHQVLRRCPLRQYLPLYRHYHRPHPWRSHLSQCRHLYLLSVQCRRFRFLLRCRPRKCRIRPRIHPMICGSYHHQLDRLNLRLDLRRIPPSLVLPGPLLGVMNRLCSSGISTPSWDRFKVRQRHANNALSRQRARMRR